MANFFDDKQYGEYFKTLDNQLKPKEEPLKIEEQSPAPQKPQAKKRKGIYKTYHIRHFGLICVAALLVLAMVIALSVRGCTDRRENEDIQKTASAENAANELKSMKASKVSFDFTADTAEIPAENDAKAAIIIRKSDNFVVAARNPHERVFPASTLKIMTLLVAVENISDFNDTFTMSYEITDPLYKAEASVAGFLNGERVSMIDLLYGLILPSGADAAVGLAVKIAGSEKAFVDLMNKKAKQLGLKDTHFANASGLHDQNNYTSAYDMAIILDTAMQNPLCREILSTYQYTTAKTEQNPDGILLSSTLFSHMYGTEPETAVIKGGKTGFVNEAGYCVASFGENIEGSEEYIVVTMGNSSKWPAFYGQIDLYKEFAK